MDRQHRHDLKHDKFVDEMSALSGKARENQRLIIIGLVAAIVLVAIGIGFFQYRHKQEDKAQAQLAKGIDAIDSPLITAPTQGQAPPLNAKYKTAAERTTAAEAIFRDVQAKYSGTDASDVAGIYLARIEAERGNIAAARKHLDHFIDKHSDHLLVQSARYSLYQLRIENGESPQVVTELNAEMSKAEPNLPGASILALLAHAYEVQGNDSKSRETYRRILTEFPDSPYALEAQRRAGPA